MDRKTKLLRALLWGVILLIAAGSVLMLLLKNRDEGRAAPLLPSSTSSDTITYDEADDYTVGGADLDAGEVRSVRLSWHTGSVTLRASTDGRLHFSEDYSGEDQYRLRYRVQDGALSIEPCQGGVSRVPEKRLTLELPEASLEELSLELASAKLDARDVNADTLSISGVSGGMELENIRVGTLNIGTVSGSLRCTQLDARELHLSGVSGSIDISGSFLRADAEATSGSVRLSSAQMPEALDVSTVSGSVTLLLPRDAAFGYRFSTVSGSVSNDLPGAERRENADVSVETTSGSLSLKAAD